jgi:crossover junction endodeoxyribonuclease RuvC
LGVDPGLARCGLAVVEGGVRTCALSAQQLVRTDAGTSTARRLETVHDAVADLLSIWRPDALAIERLLFNNNVRSAMAVAQAVGVVLLAASRAGVEVHDYTPTRIKATVTGQGDADKQQVKFLVRAQLQLAEAPRSADVADAAAVALCHLWSCDDRRADGIGGRNSRIADAVARSGPGAQVVQPARRRP